MTDSLLERRHRVTGRAAPLFYDEPLQIVRAECAWLHDAHSRRYLDACNNVPVVGHCHARVVEADPPAMRDWVPVGSNSKPVDVAGAGVRHAQFPAQQDLHRWVVGPQVR